MSVSVAPHAGPVRVVMGEAEIVNTTRAQELSEGARPPVYYLPREDADMSLLVRSDTTTFCMVKGDAHYFHIRTPDGGLIEDAVWTYETPMPKVAAIKDHLAFYPNKVDIIASA